MGPRGAYSSHRQGSCQYPEPGFSNPLRNGSSCTEPTHHLCPSEGVCARMVNSEPRALTGVSYQGDIVAALWSAIFSQPPVHLWVKQASCYSTIVSTEPSTQIQVESIPKQKNKISAETVTDSVRKYPGSSADISHKKPSKIFQLQLIPDRCLIVHLLHKKILVGPIQKYNESKHKIENQSDPKV